ncbi:MAG: hypothetical protein GY827_09185 [Cytophagales bacterium]|nr:hypothetical protein [Cytophagales bacterium]
MKWIKKGHIFKPTGEHEWSKSHAQVPFAYPLDDKTLRIFFATRDQDSCSTVTFIDTDIANPSKVLYVHDKPCLQKGKPGYFDDAGTMPSWFLEHEGKIYLYYTAWNKSATASYILSIGLAISEDQGLTFQKQFEGPLLDRGHYDPIWVGQPCVLKDEGIWKMWYLSCQKIEYIDNHPEPFYNVKYAESNDGIHWERKEITCIDFIPGDIDAIGRPCVYKEDGIYKMLHSNRGANSYRVDKTKSYRIGYSESNDGKSWIRKDEEAGIEKSEIGWDSEMNEYCTTYVHDGKRYLIYNGNGFGQSGFGYAISE